MSPGRSSGPRPVLRPWRVPGAGHSLRKPCRPGSEQWSYDDTLPRRPTRLSGRDARTRPLRVRPDPRDEPRDRRAEEPSGKTARMNITMHDVHALKSA